MVSTTTQEPFAYTVREAAELCRVCPATIWKATKDGRLKATRIGRSVRILRSELLRFVGETGDA